MISQSGQFSGLLKRLGRWGQHTWQALKPGPKAWRGATWGAWAAVIVILLTTASSLFGQTMPLWFLIGTPLFVGLFVLAGGLLTLLWAILKRIPVAYMWVLLSALLVFVNQAMTALSVPLGIIGVGFATVALASLVGAGVAVLVRGGWSQLAKVQRIITVAGLVLGLVGLVAGGVWLLAPGSPLPNVPNAAALSGAQVSPLDLPDPSQPGPYAVRTLFYGSGQDRHRPEYSMDVDLVTAPVDGSALVERWSSLRTAYWGFGPEALPRNGRVWFPEAEGGFPLVVIVHGQHPMEDFSDPGYAYLGELLASRGFIVVSVDENFLNLSPLADVVMFQSLIGVDDLRGWLLLEHLQLWREWSGAPDSPFYQKVDLNNIAMVGHSRGGQAVAAAAAFNKLPYYPDDATVRFDYNFNIRAVVAFAPVDGGYRPADQAIVLEDLSYLVLQGAHDMDVFTFQGDRQYSRVHFNEGSDSFKAALYIYGANHGQFNTSWGRKDLFEPIMRVFNLEQLIPGEEQRQIAKVAVSAFFEATLRDETAYRTFFQDVRRGQAWLPETIYLHQYQDAVTRLVCTYEEDVNPASTTLPGGSLSGEDLTLWREQPIPAKWETLGDQTVYLGWDGMASYTVQIPPKTLVLTEESILTFAMADANEGPTPDTKQDKPSKHENRDPIDLTVEVVDSAGETAQLPLSHFSLLQPQVEGQLGKARFMSLLPTSEAILQHFEFPLVDFVAVNPAFDPMGLTQVRFLFDRTAVGVIVLDNVGFRE